MTRTIPDPSDFGVSLKHGFLSPDPPLTSFEDSYFQPWDAIIPNLSSLIAEQKIEDEIQKLPLLDSNKLRSELEYQRAYVVLAFLVHAWVWCRDPPNATVPPQLSEPFLAVCDRLGLEFVVSYAGLCLWNWQMPEAGSPVMTLENLEPIASFTGSRGEAAFYHVPVLIEEEGGETIKALLAAMVACESGDSDSVVEALQRCNNSFVRFGEILPKLYTTLDAKHFYHDIRPWITGGKGMEEKGLPQGMVFQFRDGTERCVKAVGGSAVQSSLFPYIDYALGVEHNPPKVGAEAGIFQEMRAYMPGTHRHLLKLMSTQPPIRDFVEKSSSDDALRTAYDTCLKTLRTWRSKHIAVVSKYIVQPARLERMNDPSTPVAELESTGPGATQEWELQGTGGTALMPFLKQARDETVGIGAQKENGVNGHH